MANESKKIELSVVPHEGVLTTSEVVVEVLHSEIDGILAIQISTLDTLPTYPDGAPAIKVFVNDAEAVEYAQ